jgi:predicted O-methyltransferase YrrM
MENKEELFDTIQNQIDNKEIDLINEYDYTKIEKTVLQNHIEECLNGAFWIKEKYDINKIVSWQDVPGWINDAQWIFKEAVNNSQDGDILVEIGTYFGQSACYMGELIKSSSKDIKFYTFDIYDLDASFIAGFHPEQFTKYRQCDDLKTYPMSEVVKTHFIKCGVENYVNSIICDGNYAHKFYEDNSLMLVYTDGINNSDNLFEFLNKLWPKLKKGGILAGDDIIFTDVQNAVKKFCNYHNLDYDADVQKTELSWIIRK